MNIKDCGNKLLKLRQRERDNSLPILQYHEEDDTNWNKLTKDVCSHLLTEYLMFAIVALF